MSSQQFLADDRTVTGFDKLNRISFECASASDAANLVRILNGGRVVSFRIEALDGEFVQNIVLAA